MQTSLFILADLFTIDVTISSFKLNKECSAPEFNNECRTCLSSLILENSILKFASIEESILGSLSISFKHTHLCR